MQAVTFKPTKHEQKIAKEAMSEIQKLQRQSKKKKAATTIVTVGKNGNSISVPTKAVSFFYEIVDGMAYGKSVTVLTTDLLISTQQAADILHFSRPYVIKLLEEGKIPYQKIGTHRRMKLADVVAYDKEFRKRQDRALDLLTAEAQRLNLWDYE
ncbi:excisionase family DNA-binding protein [Pinibacter aurantiacus]|uniref:Helix-turn-helix domain-containing protein n=1 Tax=Pinibacter aurantiacus TaxID=2851599 RepID=A0A9E2W9N7_9BACT|nr:excisionase family DNA-binding protein [Pinibacter aurantiacus]MBV4359972.1 helix-turn-helix domain-containing protein [Pinibacter aurantiacus]